MRNPSLVILLMLSACGGGNYSPPAGSSAALLNYHVATLIVSDGQLDSTPSRVTIAAQ